MSCHVVGFVQAEPNKYMWGTTAIKYMWFMLRLAAEVRSKDIVVLHHHRFGDAFSRRICESGCYQVIRCMFMLSLVAEETSWC